MLIKPNRFYWIFNNLGPPELIYARPAHDWPSHDHAVEIPQPAAPPTIMTATEQFDLDRFERMDPALRENIVCHIKTGMAARVVETFARHRRDVMMRLTWDEHAQRIEDPLERYVRYLNLHAIWYPV